MTADPESIIPDSAYNEVALALLQLAERLERGAELEVKGVATG